jgi:ribonuclease-3
MGVSSERLELLGDACVNLVVAEMLMHKFPKANEGFITRVRVKLVSGKQMTVFARRLELQKWLVLSNNARFMKVESNDRILEDIFEAFCGAIFVDCGYDACRSFILRVIELYADLQNLSIESNHKDLLSRYVQQHALGTVVYELQETNGPAHRREFVTRVLVNGKEVGTGTAASKKTSEMNAALAGLEFYGADINEAISGIDSGC